MGSFSLTHWLILLVVVVVIFGTSKLKNAGKDLGTAVKGFKDAVKEEPKALEQGDKPIVVQEVILDKADKADKTDKS